jgi:hypothetical protein
MKTFAFLLSLLCLLTTPSPAATKPKVADAYGKLPLSFESNQGQSDAQVKFLSRGSGYTLFLTSSEAVLLLQPGGPSGGGVKQQARGRIDEPVPSQNLNREDDARTQSAVLRIRLVGANPAPELRGFDELPGKANYFIGNDPKKWRTDVPTYAKVKYHAVYRGVDLVYYGNQRQLEHDFIVAPGADPGLISLRIEGAKKLSLDSRGDLVLKTPNGEIRLQKPVIYQDVDGVRHEIAGGYRLEGKNQVGFAVATYDVTKALVVDPTLVYSTYLGGNGPDTGYGIAVDSAGNAYVTGSTDSTNFPTNNPFQGHAGNYDAFVTKLSPTGDALVYSTYLGGGSGNGIDIAKAIAVDSAGNAYVTGYTGSENFPTKNPFQGANHGSYDAFVTKLSPDGSALVYSTYLGGGGRDIANGIVVDSAGNAYVTGQTYSTNFPTQNPFQGVFGGYVDAFVTKLSPDGSTLVYSTYLGGSGFDTGYGIALDSAGHAYVTGATGSINFPTKNPFQGVFAGSYYDAFVTKLSPTGSALVYSTYLGGNGDDYGYGIAVDSARNTYVTGSTTSGNFPTKNPFQGAGAGNVDAFVTKLSATGNALVYSTYLGGGFPDYAYGIALDSSRNAYVTGYTKSTNFPTNHPFQPNHAFDAFVAKLSPTGSTLVYSSYLGGSSSSEIGYGIAVDSARNAYVTGYTHSTNFPTKNPFQGANAGGYDAFVTKISP